MVVLPAVVVPVVLVVVALVVDVVAFACEEEPTGGSDDWTIVIFEEVGARARPAGIGVMVIEAVLLPIFVSRSCISAKLPSVLMSVALFDRRDTSSVGLTKTGSLVTSTSAVEDASDEVTRCIAYSFPPIVNTVVEFVIVRDAAPVTFTTEKTPITKLITRYAMMIRIMSPTAGSIYFP